MTRNTKTLFLGLLAVLVLIESGSARRYRAKKEDEDYDYSQQSETIEQISSTTNLRDKETRPQHPSGGDGFDVGDFTLVGSNHPQRPTTTGHRDQPGRIPFGTRNYTSTGTSPGHGTGPSTGHGTGPSTGHQHPHPHRPVYEPSRPIPGRPPSDNLLVERLSNAEFTQLWKEIKVVEAKLIDAYVQRGGNAECLTGNTVGSESSQRVPGGVQPPPSTTGGSNQCVQCPPGPPGLPGRPGADGVTEQRVEEIVEKMFPSMCRRYCHQGPPSLPPPRRQYL